MPDSSLADGSYLTSSFYETYIRPQLIVACTSSTRPTGVEGRRIYETDTDREYCYDGSNWVMVGGVGAWINYTPTLTQSVSVSFTITHAQYMRYGRTVHFAVNLAVTSSGTAGQNVIVSLPVTAAVSSGMFEGVGVITDNSASLNHGGGLYLTSTTTCGVHPLTANGHGLGLLGAIGFTAALVSGDAVTAHGTYRAA